MATVTWEDFILPQLAKFKDIKDKQQLLAIKCLGVFYALVVGFSGYLVGLFPNITDCFMLTQSTLTGPTLGVFLLAILVPIANEKVNIVCVDNTFD